MITIPGTDKKWKVSHNSNLLGNISNTRNIDLREVGHVKMARKTQGILTSNEDAELGNILSIVADSSNYYITTDEGAFSISLIGSPSRVNLGLVSGPTLFQGSDGVMFNNIWHASGSVSVHSYAGTWTSRITGLSASYPHPMAVDYKRRELGVANGNVFNTYSTSYGSPQNTLTISPEQTIVTVAYQAGNYYIGTRNITGGEGLVYVWNGTGTVATSFPSGADWVYSVAVGEPYPVIITSTGHLKKWNGGGFTTIARLPVADTYASWSANSALTTQGKVCHRGMYSNGGIIYVNLVGETETPAEEYPGSGLVTQPGGLWIYDDGNWYHHAGYVTERYTVLTVSALNSHILTMSAAHGSITGDAVYINSVPGVTGITAFAVYYVIYVNTTDIQLALSRADALAGRYISLAGTPVSDSFSFNKSSTAGATSGTDYGAQAGAVIPFNINKPSQFHGADVMFGGTSLNASNTVVTAIMSLGLGRNVSSFVSPRLSSDQVTDVWQKVYIKMRELNLDTDSVVVKYRKADKFGLPTPLRRVSNLGLITWVDSTSFTIDARYKDILSVEVGDEVYFVEGAKAGFSAHVTAISNVDTVYTFTIDETMADVTAAQTSDGYFDNWKKLPIVIDNDSATKEFIQVQFPEDVKSSWIELKVEMRGVGVAIDMVQFINKVFKPSV